MKITAIEIGKIAIPLKTPFITALRRVDVAEDLVVKVHTDDGHTGYGNAPATVVITGDSHQSVAAAIKYTIGPKLIGRDIDDREDILDTIHQSMVHNTSAKAALDMAVHDLFGQRYGLPLYRFFGGRKTRIASDLTISVNAPDTMASDAVQAVSRGYSHLKLKVGIDPAMDFQRVAAIRLIGRMEDAGLAIELVEQPVAAADFDGLKQVTDHVATDIMADESAFSPRDVFRLLAMRACDLINIKLMKAGGLAPAAQIAAMADAAGVACMMGCMLESKVGITAAAALSAGKAVITKNDLDAADLMAADPVRGGITYDKDHLVVPDAPGLGITAIDGWLPLKD